MLNLSQRAQISQKKMSHRNHRKHRTNGRRPEGESQNAERFYPVRKEYDLEFLKQSV